MLVLLSPAKSLDFETAAPVGEFTIPDFLDQTNELVSILKNYSSADLQRLMDVSGKIADLNVQRFYDFKTPYSIPKAKQAIFAFNGDVYEGLSAQKWEFDTIRFAQQHLCILSGLYGLLRPLDLILPYRLEMGTPLPNHKGKDLYHYWGNSLVEALERKVETQEQSSQIIINLASQEYAKVIARRWLKTKIIDVVFKDNIRGEFKVVGIHAKRARGLMAAHICKMQISNPQHLEAFGDEGYVFSKQESNSSCFVFLRK